MIKVVYNDCYGGFGLSREAVLLARKLSGNPNWGGPCIIGDVYAGGVLVADDYGHCDNVARTDEFLVKVVEILGDKANGRYAKLKITSVPKGTKYRIDEYDGMESVMCMDDYHWDTA